MAQKEGNFEEISYVLGLASIVFGILLSFVFGLGFGMIGLILSRKESSGLLKKSKKLNIIGIVLNVVLILVSLGVAYYYTSTGIGPF
jgi:hypothetical protein